MKSFRLLLAALLAALTLAPAAHAGITGVSQVPLLNITGTGTVKPNLMLLYDNSGSMAQNYTPDYIDDSGTCRSRSLLSGGSVGCAMGHPPFASADFNRQYYNPKVTYRPAVYADGSSYPAMNRANSSTWTAVVSDAFGINKTNMLNAGNATTVNIVTGYPDVKWCTNSQATDCKNNTSAYTYPTDVYFTSTPITTNPFYYTIDAGEFCTDTNMTTCINGVAPTATYPVAAKVRWCNSKALTSCQAKYTGAFIYPRFSNPASGAIAAYGTVVIGSTTGSNATAISSVTVSETGGTVTITNASTPASAGTNSTTKARTEATDLALAIINKTGLTNSYAACVRTPTGANAGAVPDCQSVYGISLSADNVVAVIPVQCTVGAPNKSLSNCPVIEDASRSGWAVTATAPSAIVTPTVPSTALVNVTGTTTNTNGATPALPGISLNGVALLGGSLALGRNATAAQVAALIIARINASNIPNTTAYIGKNTITPACAAASATAVCIINTAAPAGGISAVVSAITGNSGGNTAFTTPASTAPVPAVSDAIPVTTTPLGAGSDPVFTRVDIVSTRTTYPRDANRTDCAGTTTCTYDEEMTNFANWYSYYKTRNQMMKTSVGQAFQPVTPNYKVGIVSLSEADASAPIPLVPKIFSGTDRAAWYTKLYAMNGGSSTPMRRALHTVGLMYANLPPYKAAAGSEVVQFPCQQNFTFVTTDGYWNGNPAPSVVNNDNVENADRFCTRGRGCLDPADQTFNSLADIALYWYNGGTNGATTSLRPELEDLTKPGLVPAAAGDNTRLHMNTYTLGLGVDGILNYEANYDTAPLVGGDFYKLITGVTTGCPWNGGGAYNWPDPVTSDPNTSTVQARVDDLWHAAINGRGKYFSASDPKQVIAGLSAALANIAVKLGAAAAAATSTPNISLQDNDIFSDTFTTVKWFGELSNKKIDTVTGIVGSTVAWTTSDTVGTKVAAATDTRVIKMIDTSATGVLKDFKYASMTAFEKAWFDNKCASLAQCASLSTADRAVVNSGANIVDWLRGQQQYANDTVLRAYTQTQDPPAGQSSTIPIVLGDIASSKPAYMREPRRAYPLAGYSQFVVDNATRAPTVFVGANDGMLHAFNAKTGEEIWAYAPRITMKKLYLQASTTYGTNHQYTADGAPEIGDVKFGSGWKSVLVAGLNGGGRGYYALDVTDPANPKALWELCADSTVCTGALFDADLGLSFGNAQFGIWNGQWVVFLTSGYNNIPGTDGVAGGDGGGYLYIVDVSNGHILKKVATSAPSISTPPGYAKITSTSLDPQIDPVTTYVYGGDNLGQMWRVDLTGGGTTAVVNRMGNAGAQQPITTRPDVTLCKVVAPSGIIAQRVVVFGTGRLLDVPDVANVDVQSLYMIKDSNTEIASWRGSSMVQQTLTKIGSGANANSYSVSNNLVNLNVKSGWYLDFDKNLGERINLDPSIVSGTVIAVTNLPTSSSACSVGGSSNIYQLNVCSGGFVDANTDGTQSTKTNSADFVAGTLLSANAGAVGFIVVRTPAGALKILVTTGNGGDPITVNGIEQLTKGSRKVGWRRVRN